MRTICLTLLFIGLLLPSAFCQQEPPLKDVFKALHLDLKINDEIYLMAPTRGLFVKTADKVEVVPIAKYSFAKTEKISDVRVGYYLADGEMPKLHSMFTCGPEAGDRADLLGLPADPQSRYLFDPGTKPFGLYVQSANFNPEFAPNGETVFTQDYLNNRITRFGKDIHKAHIFPYKTTKDFRKDWFVVCWEFSTNNDFQDIITVVRGVQLIHPPKKAKKKQSTNGLTTQISMR